MSIKMNTRLLVSALLIFAGFSLPKATNRLVPYQYPTIQAAINAASEHDNIYIYTDITENFTVNKNYLWFESRATTANTITSSRITVGAKHVVFYRINFLAPINSYRIFQVVENSDDLLFSHCNISGVNKSAWAIDDYGVYDMWIEYCNFTNVTRTIDSYNTCLLTMRNCRNTTGTGYSAIRWYGDRDNDILGYSVCSVNWSGFYEGIGLNSNWFNCTSDHRLETLGCDFQTNSNPSIKGDGSTVKLSVYSKNKFYLCRPVAWELTNGATLIYDSNDNLFENNCKHP